MSNEKHDLSPESVLARLRVSLAFDIDSAHNVLEEIKNTNVRLRSGWKIVGADRLT